MQRLPEVWVPGLAEVPGAAHRPRDDQASEVGEAAAPPTAHSSDRAPVRRAGNTRASAAIWNIVEIQMNDVRKDDP